MTRAAHFTDADVLALLRGLVALPSSSLRCVEVEEILDIVRAIRVDLECGMVGGGPRFRQRDVQVMDWLFDEVADGDVPRAPIVSIKLRIRTRIEDQRAAIEWGAPLAGRFPV